MAHFYTVNSNEHPPNGVETEFSEHQAHDLLHKNIIGWKEKDRLDCVLLLAILELSKNQRVIAQEGFPAWDVVEAVGKLRRRRWSTENDKESMSDDVRRQWKKLEVLWQSKSEGIKQSFNDEGLTKFPIISRIEGGGTGRPTKYRIAWLDAKDKDLGIVNLDEGQYKPSYEAHVRYICEDIKDPNFMAKCFAKGYLLSGWRKRVYLAALLGPVIFAMIVTMVSILNIVLSSSITKTNVGYGSSIASSLIIIFAVFVTLNPLFQLKAKGVLLAPWWMQSVDEERLLEFRAPPRFEAKNIKAVSYSAICPICQGKIFAKSGGLEFFGRIIGRCNNSPVEHIFSFDHVSRRGVYLRK